MTHRYCRLSSIAFSHARISTAVQLWALFKAPAFFSSLKQHTQTHELIPEDQIVVRAIDLYGFFRYVFLM